MEVPDQSGHEPNAVDANTESTLHPSTHLSRRRNLLASPLFRLPTELILKIFAHAIDNDDDGHGDSHDNHGPSLLTLTAICHQLREAGIASPQLWGTIDLTTAPLIAELFLERCKYDPHTLIKFPSASEDLLVYPTKNPRRDALLEKLQGHTFDRLRSIVFEGSQREFALMVVDILRRAPNVSNLDICNRWSRPGLELPWPAGDPIPNLSTLRLSKFSISWTSPLLRNLTKLVLDFLPASINFLPTSTPSERTSIEMFLTALANCPNLETLSLVHAGPELPNGRQDNCDTVVQLRRLREISLEFGDPSRVGYILSHVWYPESTKLAVHIPVDVNTDIRETISRILPRRNAQTIQQFRKSTTLTIYLGPNPHFSTNNIFVHFYGPGFHSMFLRDAQIWTQFASKIVEVVGGDTIISLDVEARGHDPPDEMWEVLLHGFPQLERICYDHVGKDENAPPISSFVLVFSRLFEVCPRLQRLELPKGMLTDDTSVTMLKWALTQRGVWGRRLKWIGLSGDVTEVDDSLVFESFRDLVGEVE